MTQTIAGRRAIHPWCIARCIEAVSGFHWRDKVSSRGHPCVCIVSAPA